MQKNALEPLKKSLGCDNLPCNRHLQQVPFLTASGTPNTRMCSSNGPSSSPLAFVSTRSHLHPPPTSFTKHREAMSSARKRRPAPPPSASSKQQIASAFQAHPTPQQSPPRVLFVIAHPDDETMFFSPTMAHYRRQGSAMSVLCVSTGMPGVGLKGRGRDDGVGVQD